MPLHLDPKPCPFCGESAEVVVAGDHGNPGRGVAYVSCDSCGAESGHIRWAWVLWGMPRGLGITADSRQCCVPRRGEGGWRERASDLPA